MMRSIVAATVLSTALPLSSRADQCAHVAKDKAAAALTHLKKGATFTHYCQPCKEAQPKKPLKVGKAEMRPSAGIPDQFELFVDGHPVDLAYTYVDGKKGTFANLGILVGCSAEDVSPHITLGPKGTFTAEPRTHAAPAMPTDGPKEAALRPPGGTIGLEEKPTGAPDPDALVSTIRARKGGPIACYEHALKKNKNLAGKIDLLLTIGKTGQVSEAKVEHDTMGDPSVAKCVSAVVRSWRFPPSSEPVTFGFPFVFHKDSDHDGIADHHDKCPHHAEDYDGHGDHDGCKE